MSWEQNLKLLKSLIPFCPKSSEEALQIINHLKSNENRYVDDNDSHQIKEIVYMGICYRKDITREPIDGSWILFPFVDEVVDKRPLYIQDGNIHLSSKNKGYQLCQDERDKMKKGELYEQRGFCGREYNFVLPIGDFMNIVSQF